MQEFNIEKLQLVEAEKRKIRQEYERKEKQVEVRRKMYVVLLFWIILKCQPWFVASFGLDNCSNLILKLNKIVSVLSLVFYQFFQAIRDKVLLWSWHNGLFESNIWQDVDLFFI